jgi:protein-tyrosine-phosphatase
MAEGGIDISNEFPKPWTDETVRAADVVISMGCGDACPIFPGKGYESWDDLDGPTGPRHCRRPPHPRRHRTPRPTADRGTDFTPDAEQRLQR